MARFKQGTTDHDGDGRMGGSLKGTNMAKKSTAKKAPAKAATESKKAAVEAQFAEADAKADPNADELDAIQKGLQVRGW